MSTDQENEPTVRRLPPYAIVQRGTQRVKGRVTHYHGRGYFSILIPGDIHLYRHRNAIVAFTSNDKGAPAPEPQD